MEVTPCKDRIESSFGGLINKHINYYNSQITVQPCISALTNKRRQTHIQAQT